MNYKHGFNCKSFVCPELYEIFKEQSIWFVDARIIEAVYLIHENIGPVTVNDWANGGQYRYSGLRPFVRPKSWTGSWSQYSQHIFGRAMDIKISGVKSVDVYDKIINNWSIYSKYITTLEDKTFTNGWTHIDCRNTSNTPLIVRP